ncbi:hypothetical protein HD806DRAFT_521212 [Xylariaceae sp. AK1471]|nr:hypothetical protein HD806DRAFT_521212 [Xylariaceae sp. AK1471]
MAPSVAALEKYLREATRQVDAAGDTVTVNSVRRRAEEDNELEKGFFATPDWKARSSKLIKEFHAALVANEASSPIPEPKTEQDTKHGVKRSSSDEPSPTAKRRKMATSATIPGNPKPKKDSSSSALSELSDSDVEPKKEKNKNKQQTKNKRASVSKQESDSELSDLDLSEDEPKQKPKQKKKAKKPAAPRKSKKEKSESELSDLSSPEDEPKPKKGVKKPGPPKKSKKEESESDLSDLSSSEDEPKPKKKGVRKSTKLEDSEDDKKDSKLKASMSQSKRKQPAPTTKQNAKRTKVKSDSEDELAVGKQADNAEADTEVKIGEDITAKNEDPEEDTKPEKNESKPSVADNSDSSLSSVLDEPPARKRKGKDSKAASKSKPSASKELTGDETEIKKLQGQLVKCGVRKIWGIELKKYGGDTKARIQHLRDMLHAVGMDGRFSEAKAREIKERRELMGELEAVNEMNELWGVESPRGRVARSKSVRKSMKEESDEDEEKSKTEDEEEEAKVKINPRVSKRMADLAFLGSESESE